MKLVIQIEKEISNNRKINKLIKRYTVIKILLRI